MSQTNIHVAIKIAEFDGWLQAHAKEGFRSIIMMTPRRRLSPTDQGLDLLAGILTEVQKEGYTVLSVELARSAEVQ